MKNRVVKKTLIIMFTVVLTVSMMAFPMIVRADQEEEGNVPAEGVMLSYQNDIGWDVDPSLAGEMSSEILPYKGALPSSYSSADTNLTVITEKDYVTSVKDQNPYGTCWAFTAMSLAETSYIMNVSANPDNVDFNEYHLVHYSYNTPNDLQNITGKDSFGLTSVEEDASLWMGGNLYLSMQSLANWIGVSNDTSFNADDVDGSHGDAFAYADAAHLKDAYILAMTDMDIAKSMIMQYGSIGISYYSTNVNDEDDGYYYYPFGNGSGNHAVTVVGWDDTISADNFAYEVTDGSTTTTYKPKGDGAWLVKNSWGAGSGLDGYFWLSYYDTSIGVAAFAYNVVAANDYDNNYHHDGSALTYSYYYLNKNTVSSASAFIADSYESLQAVGFYTQNTNVSYEIHVYRNLGANEKPQDGDLVLTQKGTEAFIGYHTVNLSQAVSLKSGERYAIVVTLSKSGETAMGTVSSSDTGSWYESSVKAKKGESYFGWSVDSLSDLNASNTSYADGIDVCIKAYTNELTVIPETSISLNTTTATLDSGEQLQLSATIVPSNATFKGVTYTSSDTSLATVDANGLVTANTSGKSGTVIITATSEYSKKTATCTITIEAKNVYVSKLSISSKTLEMVVGDTEKLTVTVKPSNATNKKVKWKSSNTDVVTVDSKGRLKAKSAGTATITATATDGSGVKVKCKITVKNPKNGWVEKDGYWYYYEDNKKQKGWVYDGIAWYYMDSSGRMATGWVCDDTAWYYMDSSGMMTTGWVYDGAWYYMSSSGAMATGWVYDGANWYYMDSSGAMATGWVYDGVNWYYMDSSGIMVTGVQYIDGKRYRFDVSGVWVR